MLNGKLTVLVLTFNEQENIVRTLDSVSWAKHILVIDSGSTDRTLELVSQYPQAEVVNREFTTHTEQWNFGLDKVTSEWVLSIDADYVFPEGAEKLVSSAISDTEAADGYSLPFDYAVYGKLIRGSLLPPRTMLYKKNKTHYVDDGHTQLAVVSGVTKPLELKVIHDDRKPLSRWLSSQQGYVVREVDKLLSRPKEELSFADRLRKRIVPAPLVVFFLVYVVRGGFLSGWRGLFYALQRFYAEILLSLHLLDRRLNRDDSN